MLNLGQHLNLPHLIRWGPLVYLGSRLYLALLQVILHIPDTWIWPATAFLVTVLVFVTNDKPFLGRENADNGPDNIYPGYAIFEVLDALPIPLVLMLAELIVL